MIELRPRIFDFTFPAPEEPSWSSLVERWYQLDAYSFGLAEAGQCLAMETRLRPDALVLASPEASNRTDFSFARSGAASPARFVHTLPNVRGVPLLQVIRFTGLCLCVQSDPRTQLAGLIESTGLMIANPSLRRIWAAGVVRLNERRFRVYFYELTHGAIDHSWQQETSFVIEKHENSGDAAAVKATDNDWLSWMETGRTRAAFQLARHLRAVRLS